MKKVFILCALIAVGFTACTFEGSITSNNVDSTATLTAPTDTMSDSAIVSMDTAVVATDTTK
jgi:hypothetical protein